MYYSRYITFSVIWGTLLVTIIVCVITEPSMLGFVMIILAALLWILQSAGDILLSAVGSNTVEAISLGIDPFQNIARNKYCGEWEHDLYVAVWACTAMLCLVLTVRLYRIQNLQENEVDHTDGALERHRMREFHFAAGFFIFIPTVTCMVIAMSFLGACRGNRVNILYEWSITLFVVYCLYTAGRHDMHCSDYMT